MVVPHRRRADADEQRAIARQPVGRAADDRLAVGRLEVRILAGGPAEADAGDARLDEEIDSRSNVRKSIRPSTWIGVATAAKRPAMPPLLSVI